jgi:hypothetical protein
MLVRLPTITSGPVPDVQPPAIAPAATANVTGTLPPGSASALN